jgi:hypothetical protein
LIRVGVVKLNGVERLAAHKTSTLQMTDSATLAGPTPQTRRLEEYDVIVHLKCVGLLHSPRFSRIAALLVLLTNSSRSDCNVEVGVSGPVPLEERRTIAGLSPRHLE